MIQLNGFQADGSPDGADGASDAVTDTVGAPPAVDSGDPIPPTAGSVVTRSGFGRPRSWVVGIGAGLLALAAIYLVDLLLTIGEIEPGTRRPSSTARSSWFSNDYDTAVLIQTVWTDSDITVRLWGTKHVEVESLSGDRFDFTSPQVVVKPYGQSCTPSAGTQGFSILNTRVIRDLAGAEIRRENFTTVYIGQQNVVCSPRPPPRRLRPRRLRIPLRRPGRAGDPCPKVSRRRDPAARSRVRRLPLRWPTSAAVAQLVAHPTCNRAVRGSSPLGGSVSCRGSCRAPCAATAPAVPVPRPLQRSLCRCRLHRPAGCGGSSGPCAASLAASRRVWWLRTPPLRPGAAAPRCADLCTCSEGCAEENRGIANKPDAFRCIGSANQARGRLMRRS